MEPTVTDKSTINLETLKMIIDREEAISIDSLIKMDSEVFDNISSLDIAVFALDYPLSFNIYITPYTARGIRRNNFIISKTNISLRDIFDDIGSYIPNIDAIRFDKKEARIDTFLNTLRRINMDGTVDETPLFTTLSKDMVIDYPSYDIPPFVTKIKAGAFSDLHDIRNLYIPSSVEVIEKDVFDNCTDKIIIMCDNFNKIKFSDTKTREFVKKHMSGSVISLEKAVKDSYNHFIDIGVKPCIEDILEDVADNYNTDVSITLNSPMDYDKYIPKISKIANKYHLDVKEEDGDELNESKDTLFSMTPYMLRNDGALLACGDLHPYIKMSNSASYETNLKTLNSHLDFLDWFYKNSLNDETKELINEFKEEPSEELMNLLNDLTNQEFCRVRTSNYKVKYGGDNGQIYFRISSTGFNWFDLIWNVVNKFSNVIEEVTVMKDKQTFGGKEFDYYYDHIPTKDFLLLSGNPLVEEITDLTEKIEKHDKLNPLLFENNKLKDDVKEAIIKIANKFIDDLKEDGVKFKMKDIILVGSNVSYNYTEDSDLDIHIIADKDSLDCSEEVYNLLYGAYRSLFNKNYDITIKGIPVEIYVELM